MGLRWQPGRGSSASRVLRRSPPLCERAAPVVDPGRAQSEAPGAPALLVALDSRRADFYIQLFAEDHATPLAAPAAILPDRLQSYVAGLIGGARLLIAGDVAELAAAALGPDRPASIVHGSAPDALGVAAAALFGLKTGARPGSR